MKQSCADRQWLRANRRPYMKNAVQEVKAVAGAVVASHDEGGVAEAFERFVL